MSERSIQALAAAVKALSTDTAKARKVFNIATEDDPQSADGWLGRVAAGDRSLTTLANLAGHAAALGDDLRSLGMAPHQLSAAFEIEYVRFTIADEQGARVAYAAALIDEREFDRANEILLRLPTVPSVRYVRAVLGSRTRRWPDVLASLEGCAIWEDRLLSTAASLMEAWAAAGLGLDERAVAAALVAESSPTPEVVRDALFCRALVARSGGDEDTARALLTDISVRWPDFQRSRMALSDPTFGVEVTDQATIDSRTAFWDPASAVTPEQRVAADTASAAKARLAEAEAAMAAMVGMESVKTRINAIKADSIVRVLRTRKGLPTPAISRHILMIGPPGVGKTQSARAIANIFCGLGLLPRPDVYETNRDKLVGRHLGDAESNTRELLEQAMGATVLIDEFGDLIQEGYSSGDAFGQAIIGSLVPHMENHRDQTVVIAAGYPMACQRVLAVNPGLRSRFATTIEFHSYTPDELIAIAEKQAAEAGDTLVAGAAHAVLRAPLERFYDTKTSTAAGDVVRGIDTLGNARFARTIIEGAQLHRAQRLVTDYGLADVDLSDDKVAEDIALDVFAMLTAEDLAEGLASALPAEWRC
ncbi:type VII secretion AAA-ATPase EccA [Mycobacterium sp. SP-6446]|uniref:type VII secretion AAA-ATPase EccA n=1 Tax=Mycobacterium sp. SP-6446 TaxID=1834162 RepID=UPI000979F938|nr:type VII secretion AAA-ATPase EccA [Mycobacterium sp. SP-6446]OMC13523.1 type VII secretion AAA-ATPase EccA [Mycobacterium sp. SP-6446]